MLNYGRTVIVMLIVVALMALGCEDEEPVASKPAPKGNWAEVLEQHPDPKVVTDADFLKRITETKLPWRVKDKASGIEMLLVPPGKFVMGMSPGDPDASNNEKPAHEVTITKPFYLGRTEVTEGQWIKAVGSPPMWSSKYDGLTIQESALLPGNYPVDHVNWTICREFCVQTEMRLPTEAEWEYACRAGVRKPRYSELDQITSQDVGLRPPFERVTQKTFPVGQKAPNALGFYDMLGNVWEQVDDLYEANFYMSCAHGVIDPTGPTAIYDLESMEPRTIRGGSSIDLRDVRSSSRDKTESGIYVGFRVARNP
jgi:formylglycine-generating enzyme required for sulfatase activity